MAKKRIKRRPAKAGQRGRLWLAVGTLAAYSATGTGKLASAQEVNPAKRQSSAPDQIQALPVRRYDIPAGPLGAALESFRRIAAVEINAANPQLLIVNSPGVSGSWTAEQALEKLLNGTGLQFKRLARGSYQLELKSRSTLVEVVDSAPVLSTSMPKFQQPLLDTPQTVSTVSQKVMQQQGNTTLRDALRNVAGISLAAGEGGAQGDNLTVRGFTARNDLFIDGMRDFGSYYRDPFNTQEVQVLQGPSSVTFGRGSTGGVVNQASKTPNLTQSIGADLKFGTDATRRGVLDVNVPLPALGEGAAFRLTGMGTIAGVAGRDIAKNRRDGFAPSLAFGLGTGTRVTLSYLHQNASDIPDYGLPWLFNAPAPVNRSNYYGLSQGNYLRTNDDIGTARIEHDFNSHVTIRNQVRYANYFRDVLVTEAQLTGVKPTTPLSAITATRHEIAARSTETFLDDQLDLSANFNMGYLRHELVTGVEGGRETSDPTRPNYTAPGTNLLNPDPSQRLFPGYTNGTQVKDSALSAGAYVLDTIKLDKHWMISGGVRFDRFDNTYKQLLPPVSNFNRVDQKPTWRGAVVYKPVERGSLYFDIGTSFNPSAETLSLTNAGLANLPPETNKTYEFGTKWDFDRTLSVNAAWFRTVKENAREASPANSLLYVLAGNQRVSGVQLDVRGRMTSRWEMLSSYAYLDSRVVSSQFYPGAIGYPLANVPRNTFTYWNEYHLPHHFEIGGGANYVSSRNASSTVPLDPTTGLVKQVPGYWVFNAMGTKPINEHLEVQVNVVNIANRFYYDQLHPAHVIPGPGRSALIGFKFKF